MLCFYHCHPLLEPVSRAMVIGNTGKLRLSEYTWVTNLCLYFNFVCRYYLVLFLLQFSK